MMTALALTAPPESAPTTLRGVLEAAADGVYWFFTNLSPAFAWCIPALAVCIGFFVYYWLCLRPRPHSLEWIAMAEERSKRTRMTLTLPRHPMERSDILPVLLLTAVYAATAFFRLGNMTGPQSVVELQQGDSLAFSYEQPVTVDKISFFTSLGTGSYELEWLDEEGNWQGKVRLDQPYNALFKWKVLDLQNGVDQNGIEICEANNNQGRPPLGAVTAQVFRLTAVSAPRPEGLWLAELALWNMDAPLYPSLADEGARALFDEREEWTAKSTYLNSSYFDEIYHPRTALEHLNRVYPYEVSHPPLGKL
ncbi:MAG: hypothetical protein HFF28_08160, partial [Oscillospiraceae bacterium]|nr:hypothetical protein [Oscillospiraceae bacterium]